MALSFYTGESFDIVFRTFQNSSLTNPFSLSGYSIVVTCGTYGGNTITPTVTVESENLFRIFISAQNTIALGKGTFFIKITLKKGNIVKIAKTVPFLLRDSNEVDELYSVPIENDVGFTFNIFIGTASINTGAYIGVDDKSYEVSFTNKTSVLVQHNFGRFPVGMKLVDSSGNIGFISYVEIDANSGTASWNGSKTGKIICN